ncbi:MAG TPA: hydrogenase maturation protease [Rhodocyclaceae bacterium]|nr:hydrogenase maturation protease [Rhodocyclaceae bacterium]
MPEAGERRVGTRVVGLGSPFGDDGAGWRVVERLCAGGLPEDVEAVACADPARDLLPLLAGTREVVLVDALLGGGVPGTLRRCTRDDLARDPGRISSHGHDLAALLDLAEVLGRLPERLSIFGIAADGDGPAGGGLTPRVAAAADRLADRLRHAMAQRATAAPAETDWMPLEDHA